MTARRSRRTLVSSLVAVVVPVALTACAPEDAPVRAGGPGEEAPAAPHRGGEAAVLQARLVAGGLGWATTPGGLFVTRDAGRAWRRWNLPARPDSVLDVALLGPQRALVASNKGTDVVVHSTADGGGTWRRTALGAPLGGPTAGRFAFEGERVVGVLLERASSSNFSLADWYSTKDGGATWSRHEAPAAGEVSVTGDGTLWLAGGPGHDQLFNSSDGGASWTPVALPQKLAGGPVAVDAPSSLPGGLTVVPVTVAGEDTASVVFLTTTDKGTTWKEAARSEVPASVGPGVTLPTSAGTGSTMVVAAPDGSAVVRVPVAGGRARKLAPRGLAEGIVGVAVTDEQLGWATFTASSCRPDKTACTSRSGLLVTRDGGESWQRVQPPAG